MTDVATSTARTVPERKTRRPWLALTFALSLAAHVGVAAMMWIEQAPQPKAGAVVSIEIVSESGAARSGTANAAQPRAATAAGKPETASAPKAPPAPELPRAAREPPSRSPAATEAPQPPAPNVVDAPPNRESPLRRPAPPAQSAPAPTPAAAETLKPVPPEAATPRDEAALRPPAQIPATAAPSSVTPKTAAPMPAKPALLAERRIAAMALRRPARIPPPPANAPRLAAPVTAAQRGADDARPARSQTASIPIVAADAAPASGPEGDTTPPRYGFGSAANPIPRYPETARANGWEGVVLLSVHVGANGAAERVSISRSSGHGLLDAAAVDAVRRWRFEPARRAGFAVAGTATVPIRFKLED